MSVDDDILAVEMEGTGVPLDAVPWEIEADDDGDVQFVRITYGLAGMDLQATMNIDDAERYLADLREAIVDAKRAELEWESDTEVEESDGSDP